MIFDDSYEKLLVSHILDLEDRIDELNEENARLHKENKSYKMWQNRSIAALKAMQS